MYIRKVEKPRHGMPGSDVLARRFGVISARADEKNGRASRRLFLQESSALKRMLRANLVFLVGLAAISFFLPLSEPERWLVLLAATVLGAINWALIERARAK